MPRLPDGWSAPDVVEDEHEVDGLVVQRAGISSTFGTEEACGAAAEVGERALPRAEFELLERAAVIEQRRASRFTLRDEEGEVVGECSTDQAFPSSNAPDRWRYSTSSGVALHSSWKNACTRAAWELIERDRILRAWHGETTPSSLDFAATNHPLLTTRSYDWRAVSFDAPSGTEIHDVAVAGVFGFPKVEGVPFALGFGARPNLRDAVDAAAREALQFLAFVWGEQPIEANEHVEPTAMRHLDEFQVRGRHAVVRSWLDGAHAPYRPNRRFQRVGPLHFVDLTPAWMGDGLRVAKALSDGAEVLTFGESPSCAHLPQNLRIHPIP